MMPSFFDPGLWAHEIEEEKEIKRKQRKIDRIQRRAEAAQRFAKGGHWK